MGLYYPSHPFHDLSLNTVVVFRRSVRIYFCQKRSDTMSFRMTRSVYANSIQADAHTRQRGAFLRCPIYASTEQFTLNRTSVVTVSSFDYHDETMILTKQRTSFATGRPKSASPVFYGYSHLGSVAERQRNARYNY